MKDVSIQNITIGSNSPLAFVLGPCVIESEEAAMEAAAFLVEMCGRLNLPFIYKSSYDKANRSSVNSFRGLGMEEGLRILAKVRDTFNIPVVTDVHSPEQALAVGKICDVVQVPAFLCRQTDLLVAAGKSEAAVFVKKGQFMAPWDMKHVSEKIASTGNDRIVFIDRGSSYGYNNLVSDMRGIPIMQSMGHPVCFDATHSVQLPGGNGSSSGGQREFVPTLARAAVAAGANMVFLETHPNPEKAPCDGPNMIPFEEIEALLLQLSAIHRLVNTPKVD